MPTFAEVEAALCDEATIRLVYTELLWFASILNVAMSQHYHRMDAWKLTYFPDTANDCYNFIIDAIVLVTYTVPAGEQAFRLYTPFGYFNLLHQGSDVNQVARITTDLKAAIEARNGCKLELMTLVDDLAVFDIETSKETIRPVRGIMSTDYSAYNLYTIWKRPNTEFRSDVLFSVMFANKITERIEAVRDKIQLEWEPARKSCKTAAAEAMAKLEAEHKAKLAKEEASKQSESDK